MIHPPTIETLYQHLLGEIKNALQYFPGNGEKVNVTKKHGVYVIVEKKIKILHVGRTLRNQNGLCGRLQDHLYNTSSFTKKYLKGNGALLRQKKYQFAFLEVPDHKKRAYLEALAIGKLCPTHIGTGAGSILNS